MPHITYNLRDNFLGGKTKMQISWGANSTIIADLVSPELKMQLTMKQWRRLALIIRAFAAMEDD